MANYRPPNTKKRGRKPNNLSVTLFLLNPETTITKITKETCSKVAIKLLMQKGYGPPRSEHCKNGNIDGKVEFPLELTNEEFTRKLVEIYPTLESACFVFMKAGKDNMLEELNPGICCFRCYTPNNVYHSERGQGRLYIRKITENEISQCSHGESLFKRLCAVPNGPRFLPIQPKPSSGSTVTTVGTDLNKNAATPVAMPTFVQLPVSGTQSVVLLLPTTISAPDQSSAPSVQSYGNTNLTQGQTGLVTNVSTIASLPAVQDSINSVSESQPPTTSNSISQTVNTIGNIVVQNQLPSSSETIISSMVPTLSLQSPVNMSATTFFTQPVNNSVNMVTSNQVPLQQTGVVPPATAQIFASTMQGQSPISASSPARIAPTPESSGNLGTRGQVSMQIVPFSASGATVLNTDITATLNSPWTVPTGTRTPTATSAPGSTMSVSTLMPSSTLGSAVMIPRSIIYPGSTPHVQPSVQPNVDLLQANLDGEASTGRSVALGGILQRLSMNLPFRMQGQSIVSNSVAITSNALENPAGEYQSQSLPSGFSALLSNEERPQSFGLQTLADATVERGPLGDDLMAISGNENPPIVQENLDIMNPKFLIEIFLETVKSTGRLELSLSLLHNDDLLKELNASTINIHTLEIQSSCEVHKVLSLYSIPSCLKVLQINNNNLNYEDIVALNRFLGSMNGLNELDLSGTKCIKDYVGSFLVVVSSCRNLRKLCLTDNDLTEEEINDYLIPTLESINDLVNINLSKSNLTETQANRILQKHRESKSALSLDLSQNALQGSEIIKGLCQLQSLEEINLAYNHVRFFPLTELEEGRNVSPINTKAISLCSNRLTPEDIGPFINLIQSDLFKLNLDFNHVGCSIWSFCSLRIKQLKVLTLENADIHGPAVQGLASLLSLATELEELNLASNNLTLEDFQNFQLPLSKLIQMKRLNLNNNPEGISVVLPKILAIF
ncbi:uncharacterized protein LOC114534494 [Dendronephthya gigantea]|uniref:uncharacterized protein LOC114534494 n=1 Tax=Dendronephthya gigantea TaxID=151771 RepID=UPI00106B27D2|nr:uncharacterized protein LOC114534494 [Dendronephthya gigantea]